MSGVGAWILECGSGFELSRCDFSGRLCGDHGSRGLRFVRVEVGVAGQCNVSTGWEWGAVWEGAGFEVIRST